MTRHANLDCAFVENALLFVALKIVMGPCPLLTAPPDRPVLNPGSVLSGTPGSAPTGYRLGNDNPLQVVHFRGRAWV